ncbi:MAG: hypothetical protein ACL7BU_14435 [Candidatus Phlomobacter fragariae]
MLVIAEMSIKKPSNRNKELKYGIEKKAALNPVKHSKQQTTPNTKRPILSLKRKSITSC